MTAPFGGANNGEEESCAEEVNALVPSQEPTSRSGQVSDYIAGFLEKECEIVEGSTLDLHHVATSTFQPGSRRKYWTRLLRLPGRGSWFNR